MAGLGDYIPLPADRIEVRVLKLRRIVYAEALAMLTLVLVIIAAYFTHEQPVYYFAAHDNKEPTQILGMMDPMHTDQAIMSWVGSSAADILNFGFQNVERRLQENRKYFTPEGWRSFSKAIERTKLVQRITEKQQVITAAPVGAPVITNRKDDALLGTEWTIQMPITVTVLSGKLTQTQRRILEVIVVRVPPSHNLSGLGIDSWIETN